MTQDEEIKKLKFQVAQLRHLYMHMTLRTEGAQSRHDMGILSPVIKELEYIIQSKEDAVKTG